MTKQEILKGIKELEVKQLINLTSGTIEEARQLNKQKQLLFIQLKSWN